MSTTGLNNQGQVFTVPAPEILPASSYVCLVEPRRSTSGRAVIGSKMSATSSERALVLVPAHNEEESLAFVLRQIRQSLPDADILVVDDGSKDQTASIALSAGAVVARHATNLGVGAALQTGYRYALSHGYSHLVQVDADGQHRPEDARKVLTALKSSGADMAIGCRFLPESGPYPMPLLRRIGKDYQRFLIRLLAGRLFADPTSGLRAMRPCVLALLEQDVFPCDYPDADVLVMLCKARTTMVEVPVAMRERAAGTSQHEGLGWIYYAYRMTLSLLLIASGRGFDPIPAERKREQSRVGTGGQVIHQDASAPSREIQAIAS